MFNKEKAVHVLQTKAVIQSFQIQSVIDLLDFVVMPLDAMNNTVLRVYSDSIALWMFNKEILHAVHALYIKAVYIFEPKRIIRLTSKVTFSSYGKLWIHLRPFSKCILNDGEMTCKRWRTQIRRWRIDLKISEVVVGETTGYRRRYDRFLHLKQRCDILKHSLVRDGFILLMLNNTIEVLYRSIEN